MASLTHRKQYLRRINALRFTPGLAWIPANGAILVFSGLALLNALIYGFGFLPVANLLSLYQSPLLNLHTLPHGGVPGLVRVILAFVALGMVYWQGWRIARGLRGRAAWVILLGSSLANAMIFLFLYPFGAADIFDNILRGRILGIYAANPFLPVTSKYAADPFYKYIAWKGWPSAYGPGWEAMAGLIARLAGNGVVANVMAFKMLPGAFLLASLGLLALTLYKKAPQHALAGTLLLAWNPIVLYETWGNGHNDMAMVFWMLIAALALFRRRYTLATLALVAGALVKFIPALLIPLAVALALGDLQLLRQRLTFLASAAILSILLLFFAYYPFWNGFKVLNVQGHTRLYTSTFPSTIYYLLLNQGWTKAKAAAIVSQGAFSLTVAFTVWKSWRVWKTPSFDEATEAAVQILLFYLLVTCLWFQNWYSLWPIGLAALLKPGLTRRVALLTSFATLSKPLGIGPLLFWPKARLAQPWLEIWLTLGALGISWIFWLFSTWKLKHVLSLS
jgi:hypothetical protein